MESEKIALRANKIEVSFSSGKAELHKYVSMLFTALGKSQGILIRKAICRISGGTFKKSRVVKVCGI